jgi:hypothetical protein
MYDLRVRACALPFRHVHVHALLRVPGGRLAYCRYVGWPLVGHPPTYRQCVSPHSSCTESLLDRAPDIAVRVPVAS